MKRQENIVKMMLTSKQYYLLIDMFNASIRQALNSGIPISKEYEKDIDTIKTALYDSLYQSIRREKANLDTN